MNILAIDTATEQFSVTLAVGENTWLFEADAGLRHSELTMEIIDMLMGKAALQPEDLSGVVCMGGPGSFTGLRIGFSTAKGLALSLGIPFAAIPTLDCMAQPFACSPGIAVPAIDAKKGAFFCALYRGGNGLTARRLCPDMDATPPEIANKLKEYTEAREQITLTGPGAEMLQTQLAAMGIDVQRSNGWGNAKTLLLIARQTGILTQGIDYDCGPEYIRKSDAEIQAS